MREVDPRNQALRGPVLKHGHVGRQQRCNAFAHGSARKGGTRNHLLGEQLACKGAAARKRKLGADVFADLLARIAVSGQVCHVDKPVVQQRFEHRLV
ncbi:hypothetical protein D3C72_1425050 [compost metagenome]